MLEQQEDQAQSMKSSSSAESRAKLKSIIEAQSDVVENGSSADQIYQPAGWRPAGNGANLEPRSSSKSRKEQHKFSCRQKEAQMQNLLQKISSNMRTKKLPDWLGKAVYRAIDIEEGLHNRRSRVRPQMVQDLSSADHKYWIRDSRTDTQINVLSIRRGFWECDFLKGQQRSNRDLPMLRGKTTLNPKPRALIAAALPLRRSVPVVDLIDGSTATYREEPAFL
ncbi:hypothetical protein F511_35329 [Dorcoceras hygrometricum]|uniref:Uncharacterized protein n=1 Tax=Dorcoceras hygrometricum TaxID=472368 RepID=A0A2Z7C7F3_9LAMI|nr:hypothetical protein F511_35329 [Dorcoceras hygrometricum]